MATAIRPLIMKSKIALMAVTCCALFSSAPALARKPLSYEPARETELAFDRYEETRTIVRHRSRGKQAAIFTAAQQPIDKGAAMVFEIRSESDQRQIPRWRCVALEDVRECFASPVRVPYLEGDQRVVLTVTTRSEHDPEIASRRETRSARMAAAPVSAL
jgi:hypothetical protein